MKITGSIMPSGSLNETSKITSNSSSFILRGDLNRAFVYENQEVVG